jgi:membrane-bound metal-dependent hydrolase YbcI (DUF457 family)
MYLCIYVYIFRFDHRSFAHSLIHFEDVMLEIDLVLLK